MLATATITRVARKHSLRLARHRLRQRLLRIVLPLFSRLDSSHEQLLVCVVGVIEIEAPSQARVQSVLLPLEAIDHRFPLKHAPGSERLAVCADVALAIVVVVVLLIVIVVVLLIVIMMVGILLLLFAVLTIVLCLLVVEMIIVLLCIVEDGAITIITVLPCRGSIVVIPRIIALDAHAQ